MDSVLHLQCGSIVHPRYGLVDCGGGNTALNFIAVCVGDGWRKGRRHGFPIHFGQTIFRANGEREVTSATYGQVDARWRPCHETAQAIDIDTICVSLGFMPNLALNGKPTRHI